jgi:hypothetical protein
LGDGGEKRSDGCGEGVARKEEWGGVFVGVEVGGDVVEVGGGGPVPDQFGLAEGVVADEGEQVRRGGELVGGDGGFFEDFLLEVADEGGRGGGVGGIGGEVIEGAADEVGAVGIGTDAWGADAQKGARGTLGGGEEGGVAEGFVDGVGGAVLEEPVAVAQGSDEEAFVGGGEEVEVENATADFGTAEAEDRGIEEIAVVGAGVGEVEGPLLIEALLEFFRERGRVGADVEGDGVEGEADGGIFGEDGKWRGIEGMRHGDSGRIVIHAYGICGQACNRARGAGIEGSVAGCMRGGKRKVM